MVGLYLNPPKRAVVLCLDEKSDRWIEAQVQALDRCSPVLPMMLGVTVAGLARRPMPGKRTHDYARNSSH